VSTKEEEEKRNRAGHKVTLGRQKRKEVSGPREVHVSATAPQTRARYPKHWGCRAPRRLAAACWRRRWPTARVSPGADAARRRQLLASFPNLISSRPVQGTQLSFP